MRRGAGEADHYILEGVIALCFWSYRNYHSRIGIKNTAGVTATDVVYTLRNIIKEDLEPWIKPNGNKLSLSRDNSVSPEDLYRIIATSLNISTVKTEQEQFPARKESGKLLNEIATSKELSALRTKPFLLLVGISVTGKARKVQERSMPTRVCSMCSESTPPSRA